MPTVQYELKQDEHETLTRMAEAYQPDRPDFPYATGENDAEANELMRRLNDKGLVTSAFIGMGKRGNWVTPAGFYALAMLKLNTPPDAPGFGAKWSLDDIWRQVGAWFKHKNHLLNTIRVMGTLGKITRDMTTEQVIDALEERRNDKAAFEADKLTYDDLPDEPADVGFTAS